jgi:beta-lactamase regulating signal transducer with metallopeptidase domain
MTSLLDAAEGALHTLTALTWKGALLALVVGAALLLMRRRLSPAWRHGLWLLVLVRFALPDVATSPWSMSRWLAVPGSGEVRSGASFLPRLDEALPASVSVSVEAPAQVEVATAVAADEKRVVVPPLAHSLATPNPWTAWRWLSLVWLLGAGVVVGVMVVLHLRMRHRVRCDGAEASAKALAVLRAACVLARVKRAPSLIITDAVRAPALFGIVRPAILLPRELAAACDPAALNLIFLHELAHLQRRDLWAQVAASLIIALHWFNPVVWWAGRRLRAEAEMAADARTLSVTDPGKAHRLGEVLLGFARHAAAGWMVWFAAATVLGISPNQRDLRRRIEALMDVARGRRTWWLMGLAAFAVLAVTGLTRAPAGEAKPDPAQATTVTGIVVDEQGKPIQGALCSLGIREGSHFERLTRTSDAQGRFRFEEVPLAAALTLNAVHQAYRDPKPASLKIAVAESEEHRIVLPHAGAWLSGKVTWKDGGAPIPGATVYAGAEITLKDLNYMSIFLNSARRKATTDAAGYYRIANWSNESKKAMIAVDAPGMAFRVDKFFWEGGDLTRDQALEADEGVSGTVVNAEGQPVQGAEIRLESAFCQLNSGLPDTRRLMLGYWIGPPTTDEKGAFRGKVADPEAAERLRLIVHHPAEGYRHVRLRDWQPGGTLTLDRWSLVQGQLRDSEGNAVAEAEVKLTRFEFEREEDARVGFSVMQTSSSKTDKQGRYRMDRVLPGPSSGMLSVIGKSLVMSVGPLHPGKTLEVNPRLPPAPPQTPEGGLRRVEGRIVPPSGHGLTSDRYDIRVAIGLVGNVGANRVSAINSEGRFQSDALPAGDYTLRLWVEPKDQKLAADFERGLSMRFKLEPDAKLPALNLGEFKLEAADFVFRPAASKPSPSAKRPTQRLNAPVAPAASYATWAGSHGSGVGPEKPFGQEGRIAGVAPASSNQRFMIRATQADGSRHYSAALTCTEDTEGVFEDELVFTPGVVVEGQMRDLPADYSGGGWVVAAVRVTGKVEPGAVAKGSLPSLVWHAWAPVRRDGRFRFASLPRGSLSLAGFGDGWTTRGASNMGCEVAVNLMGPESLITISVDTKPSLAQRLRLLHADGTPAAGATIAVAPNVLPLRNPLFVMRGHAYEPEDAEAYQRYKKQSLPGHSAVADAGGFATLGNQLYQPYGTTAFKVEWADPETTASRVEVVDVKIGAGETQVVKLTGTVE